jgi:hypothetical protein
VQHQQHGRFQVHEAIVRGVEEKEIDQQCLARALQRLRGLNSEKKETKTNKHQNKNKYNHKK